ncbi:hypothetical protein ACQKM9_14385 [Viridibacillus sp. NPDC093762]|uniref:hypothetical protein n=1 Tax=Viridibacillus sp. NPDC093762 TaxID=3390720 RepID=UPI003CFD6818
MELKSPQTLLLDLNYHLLKKNREYKKRKDKNKLLAEIKDAAKLNRFNFELAYNNNRSKLLEAFSEPVSIDTGSQQLV